MFVRRTTTSADLPGRSSTRAATTAIDRPRAPATDVDCRRIGRRDDLSLRRLHAIPGTVVRVDTGRVTPHGGGIDQQAPGHPPGRPRGGTPGSCYGVGVPPVRRGPWLVVVRAISGFGIRVSRPAAVDAAGWRAPPDRRSVIRRGSHLSRPGRTGTLRHRPVAAERSSPPQRDTGTELAPGLAFLLRHGRFTRNPRPDLAGGPKGGDHDGDDRRSAHVHGAGVPEAARQRRRLSRTVRRRRPGFAKWSTADGIDKVKQMFASLVISRITAVPWGSGRTRRVISNRG